MSELSEAIDRITHLAATTLARAEARQYKDYRVILLDSTPQEVFDALWRYNEGEYTLGFAGVYIDTNIHTTSIYDASGTSICIIRSRYVLVIVRKDSGE